MLEQLKELAAAREEYEKAKNDLDAKRKAWEDANRETIDAVSSLRDRVELSEAALRDKAEEIYQETGDKKPLTGIEIKMFETFEVHPGDALVWAQLSMPALLTLDMKKYEKVFRAVGDSLIMPGKLTETPKVTIARDLSAYLK